MSQHSQHRLVREWYFSLRYFFTMHVASQEPNLQLHYRPSCAYASCTIRFHSRALVSYLLAPTPLPSTTVSRTPQRGASTVSPTTLTVTRRPLRSTVQGWDVPCCDFRHLWTVEWVQFATRQHSLFSTCGWYRRLKDTPLGSVRLCGWKPISAVDCWHLPTKSSKGFRLQNQIKGTIPPWEKLLHACRMRSTE